VYNFQDHDITKQMVFEELNLYREIIADERGSMTTAELVVVSF
jgi:hypothetical protein